MSGLATHSLGHLTIGLDGCSQVVLPGWFLASTIEVSPRKVGGVGEVEEMNDITVAHGLGANVTMEFACGGHAFTVLPFTLT